MSRRAVAAAYRRFVRPRPWIPFVSSAAVAVLAWVFVPSLYHPYVRVESATVGFSLSCLPEYVEIDYLTTLPRQVDVSVDVQNQSGATLKQEQVQLKSPAHNPSSYQIEIPAAIAAVVSQLRTGFGRTVYTMYFGEASAIDIQEVRLIGSQLIGHCSSDTFAGKSLYRIVTSPSKRLMLYKLLQEEVGNALYRFNGIFSNVVIGLMIVALFWQLYVVGGGAIQAYAASDASFILRMRNRRKAVPHALAEQGDEAVIKAEFTYINRRLSFAKTLGPAAGFLLTVSSLSAALHSSVGMQQDTFLFLSGIQIAVVATFVGLAIRIVAQWGQRVYRDIAERQLVLLNAAVGAPSPAAHGKIGAAAMEKI